MAIKKSTEYRYQDIQTNVIVPEFNYEAIKHDFYIYRFENDTAIQPYKNNNPLDKIKHDLNAQSVVYLQGKVFYALFDKKIHNSKELKDKLRQIREEYTTIRAELIENINIEHEINNRHLLQLFLNYLTADDSSENYFNNVTGALYFVIKKLKEQYISLKIQVDNNLNLLLDVKTFTCITQREYMSFKGKAKFEDLPQFEINPSTRKMMRVFSSDKKNDKNIFVIRQPFKTRNTVEFINFTKYSQFRDSKCGILYEILNTLDKRFDDYLKTNFDTLGYANSLEYLGHFSNTENKIKEFYKSKSIKIFDSIEDDASKKLATELFNFLTEKYLLTNVQLGKLDKNALNFKIIHNKKHYEDNNLVDDYQLYTGFNIQHIALEDFDIAVKKSKKRGEYSPALNNILKEVYIKQDIIEGEISIINWSYGECTFVVRDKDENYEENKLYVFYELKISKNGKLEFNFYDFQHKNNNKYCHYLSCFKNYDDKKETPECLIISNSGDINVILDTGIFTLPEVKQIGDNLKNENNDKSYNKQEFVALFEDFTECFQKYKVEAENLLNNFKNYKDERIYKKIINDIFEEYFKGILENKPKKFDSEGNEIKQIVRSNSNALKKDFNKFFYEKTGDILYFPSRNKSEKEKVQSNFGIYYHENNSEAIYFSGECIEINPLDSKFSNATHIRKVKVYQGKLIFKELIDMLNVDFVKYKEYTVLPFPIKYLREWQAYNSTSRKES